MKDNPVDVRMTEKALDVTGVPYHLHVVKNGDDAMSYLCQAGEFDNAPKPDIVLVDLSIPRLDADEVLNEIRSSDDLKHVPIVALTARSLNATFKEAGTPTPTISWSSRSDWERS